MVSNCVRIALICACISSGAVSSHPDTELSNSCLTYGIIADKPCTVTEVPWEYSERRFNALVMTDDTLFSESFIMSKLYDTISAVELTVLLPATSRLSMLLMDA